MGGGGGVFVCASTAVLVVGSVDLAFAYNECLFEVEYMEKKIRLKYILYEEDCKRDG